MEYLSQKGIEFTEKNVAYNPEAVQEFMSMGLRSLPVIVIGDKRGARIEALALDRGFNPKAIDEALAS